MGVHPWCVAYGTKVSDKDALYRTLGTFSSKLLGYNVLHEELNISPGSRLIVSVPRVLFAERDKNEESSWSWEYNRPLTHATYLNNFVTFCCAVHREANAVCTYVDWEEEFTLNDFFSGLDERIHDRQFVLDMFFRADVELKILTSSLIPEDWRNRPQHASSVYRRLDGGDLMIWRHCDTFGLNEAALNAEYLPAEWELLKR